MDMRHRYATTSWSVHVEGRDKAGTSEASARQVDGSLEVRLEELIGSLEGWLNIKHSIDSVNQVETRQDETRGLCYQLTVGQYVRVALNARHEAFLGEGEDEAESRDS